MTTIPQNEYQTAIRGEAEPPPAAQREVTRLITYRGPADAMEEQLGRSLPDGRRVGRKDSAGIGQIDITVRTLDDSAGLLIGTADPLGELLKRLTEMGRELSAARLSARDAEVKLGEAQRRIEQLEADRVPT